VTDGMTVGCYVCIVFDTRRVFIFETLILIWIRRNYVPTKGEAIALKYVEGNAKVCMCTCGNKEL
jgi:hypothetical protein